MASEKGLIIGPTPRKRKRISRKERIEKQISKMPHRLLRRYDFPGWGVVTIGENPDLLPGYLAHAHRLHSQRRKHTNIGLNPNLEILEQKVEGYLRAEFERNPNWEKKFGPTIYSGWSEKYRRDF